MAVSAWWRVHGGECMAAASAWRRVDNCERMATSRMPTSRTASRMACRLVTSMMATLKVVFETPPELQKEGGMYLAGVELTKLKAYTSSGGPSCHAKRANERSRR
jgi:hypothetical protein